MRAFDALHPDPLYPEKESERHANKLEAWGTAALRWLSRKRRQPLWRTRRILARVRRETQALGVDRARDLERGFTVTDSGITVVGTGVIVPR